MPLPYSDLVNEATFSVLRAITLENMPLSQRQLHLKTGLPLDQINEAIAGLRGSGQISALNTIIETFVAVGPAKAWADASPKTDTAAAMASSKLLEAAGKERLTLLR